MGRLVNKSQIKVILDDNKTCHNICQWNMGIERIYETRIVNNWKKDTEKNVWAYQVKGW
jgi:hypothetical protein